MKLHTKRCDIFLSNPSNQNLITKRLNSKPMSAINDIINDDDLSSNDSHEKTDINFKINDNNKQESNFCIKQVDLATAENTPDKKIQNDKVTVTESVLSLEYF